jgi:peptide deformylase
VAVRPVLRLPERGLKLRSAEVAGVEMAALVDDLVDTMRASPACVGLAAPQIGIARRVVAIDVSGHRKTTTCHGLMVLVDPVLEEASGKEVGREGCMSVPDLTADVARATEVRVRATSPDGSEVVVATEGFEARAVQHEIDHLDGVLILDRVESLATDVFRRRVYR